MPIESRAARVCGVLVSLALLLVGCRAAAKKPAPEPPPQLTEELRQQYLESFDYVWVTVRDKHWDPNLNGVDWVAVRDELRPRVERATTTYEARAMMSDMLERLGQSHFGIIPASVYRDVDTKTDDAPEKPKKPATAKPAATKPTERGTIGVDVRVLDGKAIVTRVEPASPAERAGVKPGWEIVRIGKRDVHDWIERIQKGMSDSELLAYILVGGIKSRLGGTIGQKVRVTFIDGRGRKVTREIEVAEPAGTKANFGHLPTMYLTYESRRLPPNVGYIAFSPFIDPQTVMEKFAESMKQFRDADGIILDLRGNPGGIGGMAMGIGGYFVEKPNQRLGTMRARTGSINFILNPRADSYTGPLAVLVDELSMSTSEILAGGLQDLGRARVFGTPTPGAALPSVIERLPNGDGFQYAFADYVSTGGHTLEGRGVPPDEVVRLDRSALLAGHDPVIDAAVRWIESQKKR